MSDSVQLLVPMDARFRAIGPELAGKFCAAHGGSDQDVASVTGAVTEAVDAFVTAAGAAETVSLALDVPNGQVEVTLRCGDQSAVVTQALPST